MQEVFEKVEDLDTILKETTVVPAIAANPISIAANPI